MLAVLAHATPTVPARCIAAHAGRSAASPAARQHPCSTDGLAWGRPRFPGEPFRFYQRKFTFIILMEEQMKGAGCRPWSWLCPIPVPLQRVCPPRGPGSSIFLPASAFNNEPGNPRCPPQLRRHERPSGTPASPCEGLRWLWHAPCLGFTAGRAALPDPALAGILFNDPCCWRPLLHTLLHPEALKPPGTITKPI